MRLYKSTETAFNHNGIGHLRPVSCFVTEERNGEYELEMQYAVSDERYGELKNRRIILAKPNVADCDQPFRIYKITRPMGGIVTVYARHISYDLSGIPLSPYSAGSAAEALSKIVINSAVENPFDFWTDKNTAANFAVKEPSSIRSNMGGRQGSLLDAYGGEYAYDRYMVRLYNQRGGDNGVTIRYGKNLTDVTQEENIESVYTGAYPYWQKEDAYLELPEKTVKAEGNFDFVRIMTLDLSEEWENKPTIEQLRNRTKSYMEQNRISVPKVSIKVSFIPLEQTEEYKDIALLERVNLCDTVTVIFDKLGVNASAKCIKTVYNVLTGRYESVELGEARTNITDRIADQQKEIEQKPSKSFLQQAVDLATGLITGNKGGHVVLHSSTGANYPDEILIMDKPDIASAVNVWRWNQNGLGHSKTGYNGPYGLAMTKDGQIVADRITTGTLNANMVRIINLVADHVESLMTGTDRTIKANLYGGVLKFTDNNKLRMRLYNTWNDDPTNNFGLLQIFSGDVDESGNRRAGSNYTFVTPTILGLGEQADEKTYTGTLLCGNVSATSLDIKRMHVISPDGSSKKLFDNTNKGAIMTSGYWRLSDNIYFASWADGSAGIEGSGGHTRIYGNPLFLSSANGTMDVWSNIDLHGRSILNQSDARLKTEIKPTEVGGLELINQIDLQKFRWIGSGKYEKIGIIAQQLQEIAPELVHESPTDGHLSIKSDKFIYYLIKAIQELSGKTEVTDRKPWQGLDPRKKWRFTRNMMKRANPKEIEETEESDGNEANHTQSLEQK